LIIFGYCLDLVPPVHEHTSTVSFSALLPTYPTSITIRYT
jgi:hypothetical protein